MARENEINFCPRCGNAVIHQESFGRIRPVCPECSWIHFADPKVAAAVLIQQDGRVLLVRRTNEPYRGMWTLPAGFVDAGEDPAQAAVRECEEETGLRVQITAVLDVLAGLEHPRGADFIIVYSADILDGSLAPADDADKAEWFSRDDLPPLAFRATRLILLGK